jgi:hypothetical protein
MARRDRPFRRSQRHLKADPSLRRGRTSSPRMSTTSAPDSSPRSSSRRASRHRFTLSRLSMRSGKGGGADGTGSQLRTAPGGRGSVNVTWVLMAQRGAEHAFGAARPSSAALSACPYGQRHGQNHTKLENASYFNMARRTPLPPNWCPLSERARLCPEHAGQAPAISSGRDGRNHRFGGRAGPKAELVQNALRLATGPIETYIAPSSCVAKKAMVRE